MFLQLVLWLNLIGLGWQQLTLGFQANLGVNETLRFANTIQYIENQTGYTLEPMSFPNNTAFIQASVDQQFDFVYSGPVMFACLQLAGPGTKAMDEIVQLNKVDNVSAVELLAGAVVVRADMQVASTADLRGSIVITGDPLNLASFQAQWFAVESPTFSLFRDARAVFISPTPLTILDAILDRIGDVGFVEGGQLEAAQNTDEVYLGLKVVLQHTDPGYIYNHSTALYASSLVSGQLRTDFRVRAKVSEALLSIPQASPLALGDNYYSFTTSGDYGTIRTVLTKQGFIDPVSNMCKVGAQLASLVTCPAGFHEEGDPADACKASGIQCPQGYQCICSPCKPNIRPSEVLGLGVGAFSTTLALIVAGAALVVFVVLRLILTRQPLIRFQDLALDGTTPLGTSTHGLVLPGLYDGQRVAVKRAFPRRPGPRQMLDSEATTLSGSRNWYALQRVVSRLAQCFFVTTEDLGKVNTVRQRMGLRHSNLMPIMGISRGPIGSILVVMPLMEAGTIAGILSTKQYEMDIATATAIASDVAAAMAFCHSLEHPMIGVNLKPHHLFLDSSWRTLVGVSFRKPNTSSIWAPPECLRGAPWSREADVFAFSMLLYTLVQGEPPFKGHVSSELLRAIVDAGSDDIMEQDARPALDGKEAIHDLIRTCWAEQPSDRPTFRDIREVLLTIDRPAHQGPRPSFSLVPRDILLKGMFPDHVRALLEAGKPVPSQQHPEVTIFFSDIKGFTDLSRVMQPEAVRTMLDTLFTYMDDCAAEHRVHKMETIGDSMLCVTNLAGDQQDHAVRMGRFALAILRGTCVMPINPDVAGSPTLQLRCGMHTGPVVSGVAGKTNMRYCLYGNSVNLASRMESTGQPDRIQMSKETADIIMQDGDLGSRVRRRPGLVDVKGQGKMRTFWLLSDYDMLSSSRAASRNSFEGLDAHEFRLPARTSGLDESGMKVVVE